MLPKATLKPKEERRLLRGHRWVYRNEFASLPDIEDGESVDVLSNGGRFLGRGFYQATGGIAVRLLTLEDKPIDGSLLRSRILRARRYRDTLFGDSTTYRWVHAESDGLPAMVADRYGPVVSVQTGSPFYTQYAEAITEAFLESGGVTGVRFEVCGKALRLGEIPQTLEVELNGVRFAVDVDQGQKTGMFLDQRANVTMLRHIAGDARVLDGHCYTGLWGISAASWGARTVTGVDTSQNAVEMARTNAQLNGVDDKCTFECVDVQELLQAGAQYDIVMLDPPALAKTRAQQKKALGMYHALNRAAMEAVAHGGWLFTSSCSHFVNTEAFLEMLKRAARSARREAWVVDVRGAAPDHPVLMAMPETAYLTCAALRMV